MSDVTRTYLQELTFSLKPGKGLLNTAMTRSPTYHGGRQRGFRARLQQCYHLYRAMSILASTEDARLEALRSLAAAVAVAYRGNARSPAGLPLVSAAVDALSRALLPILAQAARGQGDVDGIAFSWLSSSMAAAAETSQVGAEDRVFLTAGLVGQILTVHRCALSSL